MHQKRKWILASRAVIFVDLAHIVLASSDISGQEKNWHLASRGGLFLRRRICDAQHTQYVVDYYAYNHKV
jgi:hypothetical protein